MFTACRWGADGLSGLDPLAKLYDWSPKVRPDNCVLVGIRNVDMAEKENIRRTGIEVFTMRDIDERGMRTVMEEALRSAGRGTVGYHISLDMDWVDPEDAPGVGTRVPVARPIARRTWRWRSSPTRAHDLDGHRRGQPGDRRIQPDGGAGGGAGELGVREKIL